MYFSSLGRLATEVYDANDSIVLAIFLEYIGKNGDSRLIQENLKFKVDGALQNSSFMGLSNIICRLTRTETI
jgi:hypothetical protein